MSVVQSYRESIAACWRSTNIASQHCWCAITWYVLTRFICTESYLVKFLLRCCMFKSLYWVIPDFYKEYWMSAAVVGQESTFIRGNNNPSVVNQAADKERIRPVGDFLWFGSAFWVWQQEEHLACIKPLPVTNLACRLSSTASGGTNWVKTGWLRFIWKMVNKWRSDSFGKTNVLQDSQSALWIC